MPGYEETYEAIRELGRGGMGVVLLARHRALDRLVAIKVLAEKREGQSDLLRRFHREAQAVKGLVHPNVARLLDYDLDTAAPYLVFEYLEGATTLAEMLEATAPALDRALELASDVASGLAAIHAQDVVHRDVKPGNVLVDRMGAAKVIDLGLALQVNLDQTRLTRDGQVLGTLSYMAPEQMLGEEVDARADVYAFGLLLFELLAGRLVFSALARDQVLPRQRLLGEIPPIHRFRSSLPPRLDRLVSRCLALDRKRRPASAMEVSTELDRASVDRQAAVSHTRRSSRTSALRVDDRSNVAHGSPRLGPGSDVRGLRGHLAHVRVQTWVVACAVAVLVCAVTLLAWPRYRAAQVPGPSLEVAKIVEGPEFELKGGGLTLWFTTDRPATGSILRGAGPARRVLLAEGSLSTRHRLDAATLTNADLSGVRLEVGFPAGRAAAVPLRGALEGLVGRVVLTLDRLVADIDRQLALGIKTRQRSFERAQRLVKLDPSVTRSLHAARPWIWCAVADAVLNTDQTLRLFSSISRAQLIDHLLPGGQDQPGLHIRTMLPPSYQLMTAESDVPVVRRARQLLAAGSCSLERPMTVGGQPFRVRHLVGVGGEALDLYTTKGNVLYGYNPDNPLDVLGTTLSGGARRAAAAPSTGAVQVEIPASFLGVSRCTLVKMIRACPVGLVPRVLAVNMTITLPYDAECPSGSHGVEMWRLIPREIFHPGKNHIEVKLAFPRWWPDQGGMWFEGFSICSMDP
jgi:hypothetical protein